MTRRAWTLVGACLGLLVAGRLLGTVELSILATGGLALLVVALVWTRTRTWELVAGRELRPARLYVERGETIQFHQPSRAVRALQVTAAEKPGVDGEICVVLLPLFGGQVDADALGAVFGKLPPDQAVDLL